jgi:hypothetical protein
VANVPDVGEPLNDDPQALRHPGGRSAQALRHPGGRSAMQ